MTDYEINQIKQVCYLLYREQNSEAARCLVDHEYSEYWYELAYVTALLNDVIEHHNEKKLLALDY